MGEKILLSLGLFLLLSTAEDICSFAKTCDECMGKAPSCSWCFDETYDDSRMGAGYRCSSLDQLVERGCKKDKIQSVPSKILANYTKNSDPKKLQLSPASMSSLIRPGEFFIHEFEYNSIKDYPVDLYFLVDLSYTMKDDLDTVSKLTQKIVEEMKSVTKDVKIGFGGFVDKPIFPFVTPNEMKMKNPCENVEGDFKCDPTFLFKHILSLTHNYDEFKSATENIRPSGNLDRPEGGLDALLQVVYCTDTIKWRENARKIVLFATDGSFHLAGDGKLAGLIKPPPKDCQLYKKPDSVDPTKEYWGWYEASETDYPSVGEVAHVLTNYGISVIFATSKEYEALYSKLADFLPSAGVGILEEKSENIVELLRENYEKIVNKAELEIKHDETALEVNVLTKCDGDEEFSQKHNCHAHPIGGQIKYKIEVKPKKCFEGTKEVTIQVLGIEFKSTINVETACKCPLCDSQDWPMNMTSKCNDRGYLKCGSCICKEGFSGEFCECSDNENISQEDMLKKCIKEGDTYPCSGRGRCVCGQCKCSNKRYEDKYCECDRQGCTRAADDNSVCGSEARGFCQCNGECKCKEGYQGKACDCLTSKDSCIDKNGNICSNHGDCDCGQCFCNQGYTGKLCNEKQGQNTKLCHDTNVTRCITCLHNSFKDNENSIEYEKIPVTQLQKTIGMNIVGKVVENCESICSQTNLNYAEAKIIDEIDPNDGTNLCIIYQDSCRIFFSYKFSDAVYMQRKIEVRLVRDKHCTNSTEILYIILGVILAIVLGGLLLLLIYKLVITIDDRKSYAQVVKELENTRWEMTVNPTYTQPSTTVLNPTFQSGFE